MKLHELSPAEGSKKKSKRIGRGPGSGWGKTSGKGQKGQKSRSGGSIRPGFEGGQMPLQRRVPKRGFNNIFAKNVAAINLSVLNRKFNDGDTVNLETLKAAGIVKNSFDAVKVLGNGKLEKKLTVQLPKIKVLVIKKKDGTKEEKTVNPYSESAKAAIEAAGGTAEVI